VTRTFLVFVFLLGGNVASRSADDPCGLATTQLEANECYKAEYLKSDAKLNATYHALRQKLSSQSREKLRNAQLAWIKFRDANCEFVATEYEGGTASSLSRSICLKTMTEKREVELQEEYRRRASR